MTLLKTVGINLTISKSRQRIINEGVWAALGQIVSAIGTLVGIRLLTEYVPPAIFGSVSLFLGMTSLFSGLFCAPTLQAALRYYPEETQKGRIQLLRYSIEKILKRNTLLLIGFILTGGAILSSATHVSYWIFVLLAGLFLVDVIRGIEINLLTAARRQRPYALWNAAEAWLKPAAAIVIVILLGATLQSVLFGYIMATVIGLLLVFTLVKREGILDGSPIQDSDTALAYQIRKYAIPLIPLAIVGWISSLSDRYIIGGLVGLEQVGIYAAVYGLASRPFLMAGVIIELTLRPTYFDAISTGQDILEKKIFNVWLGITIAVCAFGLIAIMFLHSQLEDLLLAKEYRNTVTLMPWIAFGYSLLVISNVIEKPCYAYKKTKLILYIQTSGAIASIIIGIPLVYYWGLQGAAVAVPLYFGTQLLISIYLARQARGYL